MEQILLMTPAELEQSPQVTLLHSENRVRLLAARFAGAPFAPPFNLRSPSFDDLLEERRQRSRLLSELREWLIEALFRAVPTVADRGTRHRLLETKRRIFNGFQLNSADLPLTPDLLAALTRYRELFAQEEACFGARIDAILGEIRQQLQAVWADPRFRLACRQASPDLVEDLEKEGFPVAGDLTSIERGFYAFVSRWTSKANPFHLFAEVAFPPASGIAVDGDHEIVLAAADLLAIERKLLPRVDDPQRIHLVLRPFQHLDGKLVFWIPTRPGFRRVARPSGDPVLQATIGFFAEQRRRLGRPTGTLAEWLAAGNGNRESLAELCREGILEPYLIPDLDRFGEPLRGIDPDLDPELDRMAAFHLARVSTAALESFSAATQVHSYVNSYRRLESDSFETAAEEVGPTLQALKPCFEEHNFSSYDYVIRSYLLDYLAHSGRDQVPYLEILRHFLRHHQEIISRYQPKARRSQAERDRRTRQADKLRRLTGRVDTAAALRALELPFTGGLRSLCFNGPFDFVERIFYVSNIFAGAGRFAGRYLLHRRQAEESRCDDGDLHVELAVPPEPNLNYVVRRFSMGCGFEARYAHKYERWIDPSEILVAREGEVIAYRDAVSGQRLRLHYSGFQLAPLLPAEYQLLLAGHADSFHNPFLRELRVGYDPGLEVGPVCLRRESWVVGQDFWGELPRERSSIRFAACLRDLVQGRLAPNDLWYYNSLQGWPGHLKPRFLDLRSPLSAYAFQREIAAQAPEATVFLSPMRPGLAHLHHRDGSPVVTELMIEV
jgi:hypothetical protein